MITLTTTIDNKWYQGQSNPPNLCFKHVQLLKTTIKQQIFQIFLTPTNNKQAYNQQLIQKLKN